MWSSAYLIFTYSRKILNYAKISYQEGWEQQLSVIDVVNLPEAESLPNSFSESDISLIDWVEGENDIKS